MNAEIKHFFETASEKEKRQEQAWWNHELGTIREQKAEAARRQELGVKDELSSSRTS
jgi:hypothetical protein